MVSLPNVERIPVFQFRRGGIKGVLVQYPNKAFDELVGRGGKEIAYRPSMLKYKLSMEMLEICDVSKPPGKARLNVQFILLLRTLGIPIKVLF
jgi:RNA-dependent RNA polymerase